MRIPLQRLSNKLRMEVSIPDLLTFLRLLLIAPVSWAILTSRFTLAFALFIAAAITDILDGRLARLWKQETGRGKLFDLTTDGLLFLCVLIALYRVHRLWPVWVVLMIATGLIAVIAQSRLMLARRSPTTYNDGLGKVCGGATYACLAGAIMNCGVQFLFAISLPLIYFSVLRDWRGIERLISGKRTARFDDSAVTDVVERDLLLTVLRKLDVAPFGFSSWFVVSFWFAAITLTIFYRVLNSAPKGMVSFMDDTIAFIVGGFVIPAIAWFWAHSVAMVRRLREWAKQAALTPQNAQPRKGTVPWRRQVAYRLTVPILLPVFEALFFIPAQFQTTRNEYFHVSHQFFAVMAFFWFLTHYMVVMYFVHTLPPLYSAVQALPARLNVAHPDGLFGLSGFRRFIAQSFCFVAMLIAVLAAVIVQQYRTVALFSKQASSGISFATQAALGVLALYGMLVFRLHRRMFESRERVLDEASRLLGTALRAVEQRQVSGQETTEGIEMYKWAQSLPTWPIEKELRGLYIFLLGLAALATILSSLKSLHLL